MDSISKKYGDYKYFSFLEEKDLDKLKDISYNTPKCQDNFF